MGERRKASGIGPWRRAAATVVVAVVATAIGASCTPKPLPPNIVFILSDDEAPGLLSKMPFTNGRDDWVRFENAFVNNPLCCPSRATLLSGQYSHHHGVEENYQTERFDESNTLATWLDAKGYRTGLIGKYLNGYPFGRSLYKPPGWDSWQTFLGEPQYYDYRLTEGTKSRYYGSDTASYSTDVLSQKAVQFINGSTKNNPFFLYFSPKAPHNPFNVPTPRHQGDPACAEVGTVAWDAPAFAEADVGDKPAWVRSRPFPNVGQERTHRRLQCEMLRSLDDGVRSIFAALEAKGVLENTVVIYMTDNGYGNGDHRAVGKRCAYEECVSTPLLVRYPQVAGKSVSELVSNVDIASTIADIGGATPQRPQDGQSLVPLIRGEQIGPWAHDEDGLLLHYIGGGNPPYDRSPVPGYWGIRTQQHKYVELATGEEELYDLVSDPFELENRAGDPLYLATQLELQARLAALKPQA